MHRGSALRAAPGRLVLARGASARVRRPADRPLLPRRLHASPRRWRSGRSSRLIWPSHLDPRPANDSGRSSSSPIWRVVLYIGIFAFRSRRGGASAEDYFLAGRSLGPTVFLLSLFGTNMTAFSILGASGHAFANGIVTFGLMALLVGAGHSGDAAGHRHAPLGARQAPRLHDAGADVPRPLGVRAHRHGDLRGAGGAARALHHHRRHRRRHDAADGQRRPRAVLARRRRSSRSWS